MASEWTTNTNSWTQLPPPTEEEMEVVRYAQECLTEGQSWEAEFRVRFDYDYKFANGDTHNKYQWDSDLILKRELEDRPILTVNKVQQHNLLIINDSKQNKTDIKIRPVGDEASFEGAQLYQELIYHIQYISSADNVYDKAIEWQVNAGRGAWYVTTEFISPKSFDQEVKIKLCGSLGDPRGVYFDPHTLEPDKSDMRWALIFEDMDKKLYKKEYPDFASIGSSTVLGEHNSSGEGWLTKDNIRLAILYKKEEKPERLVSFIGPNKEREEGFYSDLSDDGKKYYREVKKLPTSRERKVVTNKIWIYKIAGNRIIQKTEWLGETIPVVILSGVETIIDNIYDCRGHTRALINPQQIYNYNCLDLNTPIPTLRGWTIMGEVEVGDWLFNEKGEPVKVIGTSPINVNRKCFNVQFDCDNNIVTDDGHLWTVEERGKAISGGFEWKIKTLRTDELIPGKHFIYVTDPLNFKEISLPIDPYILGVWLGDGSTASNRITCDRLDASEMINNLSNKGYEIGNQRVISNKSAVDITIHGLRNDLINCKLLGNKFIPNIYLRASYEQRLELLRGLMDTDGCVHKSVNQCIFVNTNKILIDGFCELARSLGIKVTIKNYEGKAAIYPNGDVYVRQDFYRVTFTTYEKVFKLSRKDNCQSKKGRNHIRRTKRHKILSIVPVNSVPVKCITVDTPSKLFLAGEGMIPTHNTSANVEFGALQTKSPYVAPALAIEGYEEYYKTANSINHSYLPYNAYDDEGNALPPPKRSEPPMPSEAYVKGMEISQNELMMASGQWQAQLGENENAKSGVAINARQRQGDRATYHFIDNQAIAIRRTGKILIEVIPKIYDTKRIIKITSRDNVKKQITIDPNAQQALQKGPNLNPEQDIGKQIEQYIFNPNVGMYDIQSDVGPSFATKRQEAANALTQLATTDKNFMSIAGDLFFGTLDFPDANVLAERYRRTIPPNIIGNAPDPQTEALMNQATQHIQQLQSAVAVLNQKLEDKSLDQSIKLREIELEEKRVAVEQQRLDYEAETKRVTALGNAGPAISIEQIQPIVKGLLAGMVRNGELIWNAKGPHEGGSPIMLPEGMGDAPMANAGPSSEQTPVPEQPPIPGARKAADGKFYIQHPNGQYMQVMNGGQ